MRFNHAYQGRLKTFILIVPRFFRRPFAQRDI
nr:MAG TPA: hypothetical protein [Caudoviricetes sp.]